MKNKTIIGIIIVIASILTMLIFYNNIFKSEKDNITLIGYSKYSTKWIDIKNGAISASEKYGYNLTAIACDSKQDIENQILLIENALKEDVDLIILLPTDLNLISSTLSKVQKSKTELIILDDYENEYKNAYVGANIEILGKDILDNIFGPNDKDINIGCIYAYDDAGKSFKILENFEENSEFVENVTIVAVEGCYSDVKLAGSIAKKLSSNYDLDYIICFDETITKGVASFIKEEIEENEMNILPNVVGIGYIDDCARFLEEDILTNIVVQNYYGMGFLGVNSYFENLNRNMYVDYLIINKEDLYNIQYQKILFNLR